MQTFVKFILWLGVLIVTTLVANINPISTYPIVYYLPLMAMTYYFMKTKEVSQRGVTADPRYLNMIKAIVGFLGLLISSGVDIPIIHNLLEFLTNIIGNYDQLGTAIDFLVGFILMQIAVFSKKESNLGKLAAYMGKPDIQPKEINL